MSEVFYNLFILYLFPWMNIFPLRLIVTSFALNTAVHTASKSFPIDTIELFVRLSTIKPSRDSSGKSGKSSKHGFHDCMVWTFGDPT